MTTPTLTPLLQAKGALSVSYQPVFDVRDAQPKVHAFEALTCGTPGTGFESASLLFHCARQEGKTVETDRLCVSAALGGLDGSFGGEVSLNVHASTLGADRGFDDFLAGVADTRGIPVQRLTVEVLEHDRPEDDAVFARNLDGLRRRGARIALDDVGLGLSNYRMMLDCDPDYLKVDRHLVMGCDQDMRRRAVLDSVFLLGGRLGARVIAEGVETQGELDTLVGLGFELVQGYLLSRPLPAAMLLQSELILPAPRPVSPKGTFAAAF